MQGFLDIFDIYLLEAVVNGILLGGVLALLALGLNLIFGVIDVTWICYAELVMIGMYGMYYLVQYYGLSYFLAAPIANEIRATDYWGGAKPRQQPQVRTPSVAVADRVNRNGCAVGSSDPDTYDARPRSTSHWTERIFHIG